MIQNSFLDVSKTEAYTGTEPVTLAEAKAHCRVDFTDDDTLITGLITAARTMIEDYCHVSLVQKTVTLTTQSIERPQTLYSQPWQVRQAFNGFELPYGPIKAVSSVTSVNSDGFTITALTLNADYFLVGVDFQTIKIVNNYSNNILVYITGYNTLPPTLKLAILNELSYRYDHRGEEENMRATTNNQLGICEAARVLAEKYKRLNYI